MKNIINTPHDKFFRRALSDARVAKAFFQQHLPASIQSLVDLDSLQLQKESFVDQHLKLAITDMLFSANFQDKPGYLYLLTEHWSTPKKLIPFILLKYQLAIMEQHLKTFGGSTLPIVYPLVFYANASAYPYSMDVFNLFEDTELARQVFLQPAQLVDVSQIPDETLKQETWQGIMTLCMKHVFARDILPFLADMIDLFRTAEQNNGSEYVQAALTYLFATGEVSDSQAFIDTIQNQLSPETGASIMTIAQQFEAKGEARGEARGEAKGREIGLVEGEARGEARGEIKAKKLIAQKLLQQDLSIESIAQITGLNVQEVSGLKNLSH